MMALTPKRLFLYLCISISLLCPYTLFSRSPLVNKTLYENACELEWVVLYFKEFSFPSNFRTGNALVLKIGTLPLGCLFSNTLLAIFDILFRSRVIYRFVPKMAISVCPWLLSYFQLYHLVTFSTLFNLMWQTSLWLKYFAHRWLQRTQRGLAWQYKNHTRWRVYGGALCSPWPQTARPVPNTRW